MRKILQQGQNVSDAITPQSIRLSRQVRLLVSALRGKTEASPFAPETRSLSHRVNGLRACDSGNLRRFRSTNATQRNRNEVKIAGGNVQTFPK